MRKSIELHKRAQRQESEINQRRAGLHRAIVVTFVFMLVTIDGLGVGYMLITSNNQIAEQQAAMVQQKIALQHAIAARISHAETLEAITRSQPQDTMADQSKTNQSLGSSIAHCDVTNPTSLSVIVNKKHCINPVTWEPSDLTEVAGVQMRAIAAEHMVRMMQAAEAAGVPFVLTSGYRSYNDQEATYAQWVASSGSTAAADNDAARPGFSEHQTGLAADIKVGRCALGCVATTPAYDWLQAHAAEYGFIQRYQAGLTPLTGYSAEPWHWRYIGTNLAAMLKKDRIVTLEAFFSVSGGDYAN